MAAATAVALSSCSKNEVFETPDDLKNEISLSTYVGTTTKAVATTSTNFTEFVLSAYYTVSSSTSAYINAQGYTGSISAYDTASSFTADNSAKYYWPTSGSMDFYGYTPKTDTSGSAKYTVTYTAPTYTSGYISTDATLAYTPSTTIGNQIDLLVATPVTQTCPTPGSTASAVNLAFTHALTQIAFNVKGGDTAFDYHVKSIKINNVRSVGTYTMKSSDSAWSEPTTPISYTYYLNDTGIESAAGVLTAIADTDKNTLMLVPQTLGSVTSSTETTYNAQVIEVGYYVTEAGKSVIVADFTANTKKYTLSDSTEAWIAGKSITYNVTLPNGAQAIELTASLTDWTVPATNQTVTVK